MNLARFFTSKKMSKRTLDDPPASKRGRYEAAKYLPEVKQAITEIADAAAFDGISAKQFCSWLEKTATPVKKRTLNRWMAKTRTGLPVISPTKKAGALSIATTQQTAVLCGYVLHQNAKHVEVSRQKGADFMFDQFGLDMTNRTIGNIFAKADLTRRRMRTRTAGYMKTEAELTEQYVDYVKQLRREGALNGTFATLDFTTTRHQVGSRFSYGASGSGPLKNARKTTSHTNNLLTCVLQDGSQVPCLLYTLNMAFRLDWADFGKPTKARLAAMAKVRAIAAEYGIDVKRIRYAGKTVREGLQRSFYAAECHTFTQDFLTFHEVPVDRIFSDGGASFQIGDESVPELFGYKHSVFPADVHQCLSVSDNKLHGMAKQRWRNMGLDLTDDVRASLALMHCLDSVAAESNLSNLRRNLLMDEVGDLYEAAALIVAGGKTAKIEYHRVCYALYDEIVNGVIKQVPLHARQLASKLDGVKW
jgi:hypothetical protein